MHFNLFCLAIQFTLFSLPLELNGQNMSKFSHGNALPEAF